jgi:hypothetical protein
LLVVFTLLIAIQLIPSAALAQNRPPKISGTPKTSIPVGGRYYFQPRGWDAEGAKLVYSVGNKPAWVTFSTTTGLLTGYPKAVGTFANIVVSVSDGVTKASLAGFTVAVVKNAAPTIKGTPATTAQVSQVYSFQPMASDPEGQKLTFSIQNQPSWTTFTTSKGKLSGTPTASNLGSFKNIIIRASDGVSSAALPA